MIDMQKTLGELLSDPLIAPVAKDAVRGMDLSSGPQWKQSLAQLREAHFGGGLQQGFSRLFDAARSGAWHYALDSEEIGGTPFLGARKPVIKAHGSSDARAIRSAVRQAMQSVERGTEQALQDNIDRLKELKEQ